MAVELLARHRKALLAIAVLLVVSPLFGVVGAELVGYHEPLDVAAEKLGLEEAGLWSGLLPDYTVPGLPEDWAGLSVGYIISGLVGVAIILAIGLALLAIVKKS